MGSRLIGGWLRFTRLVPAIDLGKQHCLHNIFALTNSHTMGLLLLVYAPGYGGSSTAPDVSSHRHLALRGPAFDGGRRNGHQNEKDHNGTRKSVFYHAIPGRINGL